MAMRLDFNMWLKIFGFIFITMGLSLFEVYDLDIKKIVAALFFGVGTIMFIIGIEDKDGE